MTSAKDGIKKQKLENDFLYFTRYFFKENYNRKFVVSPHHKKIADKLQEVIDGKCKRLIINIAPRYGKTELAVKAFIAYGFALNPRSKFLHVSYSQELAVANSEEVRDSFILNPEYDRFFNVGLNPSSTAKKKWETKEGGVLYATATGGQVTGFGAGDVDNEDDFFDGYENTTKFSGAIVIDDPIKPEDADHPLIRNKVNLRFESTLKNRVNSVNTPIIVIMQRLHEDDLCGHLLNEYDDEWDVLKLPCIDEDGKPLWEFKHDLEWLKKEQEKNPINFSRQYMQNPKSREGLLYGDFKTYNEIPSGKRFNYTDTADTGSDFLCSISYVVNGGYAYVLDVVYDDNKNELTEPIVVDSLKKNDVGTCYIESNNGGRAFSRNVDRLSKEIGNGKTTFKPFHQSKNKISRILSNSSNVMNHIIMPYDWSTRYPKFYKDVSGFLSQGKNPHDDAADTLTGVYEKSLKSEFYAG
tara:strand:- start:998 stop:2401 length:1404 start_codon:yes stop_codon:yes gene_type:complete